MNSKFHPKSLQRLCLLIAVIVGGRLVAQGKPISDCPKPIAGLSHVMAFPSLDTPRDLAEQTIMSSGRMVLLLQKPMPPSTVQLGSTAKALVGTMGYTSGEPTTFKNRHSNLPVIDSTSGAEYPVPDGGGWGYPIYANVLDCQPNENESDCEKNEDDRCGKCEWVNVAQSPEVNMKCVCDTQIPWNPPASSGGSIALPVASVTPLGGGSYRVTYQAPGRPERITADYTPAGPPQMKELRYADGTIAILERYASGVHQVTSPPWCPIPKVSYRLKTVIDPSDNRIELTYHPTLHCLESIRYPDGTVENWTWDLAWQTGFSKVDVTYVLPGGAPSLPIAEKLKWSMIFQRVSWPGQPPITGRPFAGDRLFRIFYPMSEYVPQPATPPQGWMYGDTTVDAYTVFEFGYTPHTIQPSGETFHLLTSVTQHRSQQVGEQAMVGGVTTFTCTYESAYPFRVQQQSAPYLQATTSLQYALGTTGKVTQLRETNPVGTLIVSDLDGQERPTTVTVTPTNDAAGRPRHHDPDKPNLAHAVSEPSSLTWLYEYDACSNCPKPKKVTDPLGRITEYTYHPTTGYLTQVKAPNPAKKPWNAEPDYVTFTTTYYQAPNSWLFVPQTISGPDGTWTLDYTLVDRADPSHGKKIQRVVRRSPIVSTEAGPEQVESEVTLDTTAPQLPQVAYVGQLLQAINGDRVTANWAYDSLGHESLMTKYFPNGHANGVAVDSDVDASGRYMQITSNATAVASLRNLVSYARTPSGAVLQASTTDGTVPIEHKLLRDRWGNVAVVMRTNKTGTGAEPDAHGGSAETARAWIRDEFHYTGGRLDEQYIDRRGLNRDEAGAIADDPDARYLYTAFVRRPDGLPISISNPNDSTTTLVWDGYGTLYRSYVASGSKTASGERLFVNGALEVTKVMRGDVSLQLWTLRDVNDAGFVYRVTEPTLLAAPPGYTGSLGGAVHEFEHDSMGRTREARALSGTTVLAKNEWIYDELGRVRRTKEHVLGFGSGIRETVNSWSKASQLLRTTGSAGRFKEYIYEVTTGRLSKVKDSNGANPNEDTVVFEANTDFVREVKRKVYNDAPGQGYREFWKRYTHDSLGRVLQINDLGQDGLAAPRTYQFRYYTTGMTEQYIDPLGRVQRYLPDALGRMVEHVKLSTGSDVIRMTGTFVDWTGNDARTRNELRDDRSLATITHYDFAGRPFLLQSPGAPYGTEPDLQNPQRFSLFGTYDPASRLTEQIDGGGVRTSYRYDGLSRLLVRESPNAHNLAGVSPYATRDVYNRDGLGRIVDARSFLGDIAGTPSWTTLEAFEQDSLGRMHKERFWYSLGGSNSIDVTGSYQAGDPFRAGLTYSNGLALAYTPDAIGRLANITWQGAGITNPTQLASYKHFGDAVSQRTLSYLTQGTGTTDFTFDNYARLAQIEDKIAGGINNGTIAKFEFEYDILGNLKKEKYAKIGGPSAGVGDRFTYDDYHRLQAAWLGVDQTAMDAAESALSETTSVYVKKLTYQLDDTNNRTAVITRDGPSGSPVTEAYTVQGASSPQGPSNRYETVGAAALIHDDRGNTIYDGRYYYLFDYRNRLAEVYQFVGEGGQSLTSGMGLKVVAADVPSLRDARSRIWTNFGNDPKTILAEHGKTANRAALKSSLTLSTKSTTSSSTTTSLQLLAVYLYDVFERRTARVVVGQQNWFHAYDGWQETEECVNAAGVTTPVKQFVWGERLNELVSYAASSGSSWVHYFVHCGGQDCVTRVVDASGGVAEAVEYDAFGRASYFVGGQFAGLTSSVGQPWAYKGTRLDTETGLLYIRYRHYSPEHGRFVSVDPIGDWGDGLNSGNGYAYSANSPTCVWDPLGLQGSAKRSADPIPVHNIAGQDWIQLALGNDEGLSEFRWSSLGVHVPGRDTLVLDAADPCGRAELQRLYDKGQRKRPGSGPLDEALAGLGGVWDNLLGDWDAWREILIDHLGHSPFCRLGIEAAYGDWDAFCQDLGPGLLELATLSFFEMFPGILAGEGAAQGLAQGTGRGIGQGTAAGGVEMVNPAALRWTQRTAGGNGRAAVLRESMGAHGYAGDPIDVVRTADGLVTVDHTRAAVALELGIESIPARIHLPGDVLPASMAGRFGSATTWGEAAAFRAAGQRPPLLPTGTPTPPRLPR